MSTQKINTFDLFDSVNFQNRSWKKKVAIPTKKLEQGDCYNVVEVKDSSNAFQSVIDAWKASHFAPTGKNSQSSRGHVVFIVHVYRKNIRLVS